MLFPSPEMKRGTEGIFDCPHELVDDTEKLLGLSQGKGRDENAASRGKNGAGFPGERFDLLLTVLRIIGGVIAVGALQDQRVDLLIRENRSANQTLGLQGNIARVKKETPPLAEEDSACSQDMSRGQETGLNPSPKMELIAVNLFSPGG